MAVRHIICYILAVWIFAFSGYRDWQFHEAIAAQPHITILPEPWRLGVSAALMVIGQIFVWTSFLRLGITGTFLGDYCGILMDAPVTTFPFNVLDNPMYTGSTMSFAASAIYGDSPLGLALTALVAIVYLIALQFEGPYTARIYAERAAQQKQSKKAK